MWTKLLILSISLIIFLGCAGSPARIGMMSTEELQSVTDSDLCNAYAVIRADKVKAELKRRNVISANEWALIEQKKICIGMSELGLICSWGYPGIYGSVNTMVSRYGVNKQWVFRLCDICKTSFVHTENGEIISWQD